MTTLRDIASRANVSTSTVSRVLNDYPYVDDTTRSLVLQIAQELGYTLSVPQRGALTARSVLLLVRDEENTGDQSRNPIARDFERTVSAGVQAIFDHQGIATRLQRTRMDVDEAPAYANDPAVAGLILLGGMVNRSFVRSLQQAGIPFVIAGAHVLPLRVNCVMADVARGTEQAIEHLVGGGRRAIGLVNGPETTATSAERLKGVRLALAQNDLPLRPNQIITADFHAESGYAQTLQLLARRPDLDAILYADDVMAMGGLRAIKESGRRIPHDVAVVGFYDYDLARFTDPPLTSMRLDMRQIGTIAAKRLGMLLESPEDQDWFVLVEASLVVREST
jgi:DNA-binding LacI/PurR family transcriptional regulator